MRSRRIRRVLVFIWIMLSVTGAAGAESGCVEHDYQWITLSPNCTEPGYQGYQCGVCGTTFQLESLPQLGHLYRQWETIQQTNCSEAGLEQRVCARCGYVQSSVIEALPHTNSSTVTAPTCKTDGYTLNICTVCGHREKTDPVSSPGHQYSVTIHAPDCTEYGYTQYWCRVCGDLFQTDRVEPNGHVYDTGVLTKAPTARAQGTLTYTCLECDDSYTERTAAWDGAFQDVDPEDYCFAAVLWAVDQGITEGVDETHFCPDAACTRAQVVTFLWREAGEPKPKSGRCPFADVSNGAYYYNAVLWAMEQGITKGVDETHFGPNQSCTRCQVMTFLHRSKGSQGADAAISFTDVKAEDYFCGAVRWAYETRITVGTTPTQFSPHAACTRGQIVTFLFRAKDV